MVLGHNGHGGAGAVAHAHKAFSYVVGHVQIHPHGMVVKCVLDKTVKQEHVTTDHAQ